MGSAKTRLKVDRFPSRSGFTNEIMAACSNSTECTQSLTVWGVEADLAHQTSWLESTDERDV